MLLQAIQRKVNTKSGTKLQSWISANRPFRNRADGTIKAFKNSQTNTFVLSSRDNEGLSFTQPEPT